MLCTTSSIVDIAGLTDWRTGGPPGGPIALPFVSVRAGAQHRLLAHELETGRLSGSLDLYSALAVVEDIQGGLWNAQFSANG